METLDRLETILGRFPSLTVGVVGDLFLDRYLDLDARLTEPSIETGLDAYQATAVRASPGAAGTVINNLVALGVGRVVPLAFVGDDGEGYELRQALSALSAVDASFLSLTAERRTPTYTKPLLHEADGPPRELNRIDIKNRLPLPQTLEDHLLAGLERLWPACDALVVLDQVSEADCGVVTARMRDALSRLAHSEPAKFVLADSRERIGLFRDVCLKPNEAECCRALGLAAFDDGAALTLAERCGRQVLCTQGERGILIAEPPSLSRVAAFPVTGPIDVVGAGDSCSAALVSARAAGATLQEAAFLGNLVASITIQQIGTTGTASPRQVRRRWHEVRQA